MKRIIRKLVVFALIGILLVPITVLAEGIPPLNINIEKKEVVVGDEFSVKLSYEESEKLNTDIKLTYDAQVVELIDDSLSTVVQGKTPSTVDKSKKGEVVWSNIKNAGVKPTFKAIKDGEFNFKGEVVDAYVFSSGKKATPEELVKMTGDAKIIVKKEVQKDAPMDKDSQKETPAADSNKTTEAKDASVSTGFIGSLIDGLKQDWTLRILFIAVILIIILLIVFLIEALVKRKKSKLAPEVEDEFSPENLLSELSSKRERRIRRVEELDDDFALDAAKEVIREEPKVQKTNPQMSNPTPIRRIKRDADGNPIRRIKRDADGNPIRRIKRDADGNPIRRIKRDAGGNPIRKNK